MSVYFELHLSQQLSNLPSWTPLVQYYVVTMTYVSLSDDSVIFLWQQDISISFRVSLTLLSLLV